MGNFIIIGMTRTIRIRSIAFLIVYLIVMMGCAHVAKQCPEETVVLSGSLVCNGEWRDIYTVIEAGELDSAKNYMTFKEWEELKKELDLEFSGVLKEEKKKVPK